MPSDKPRVIKDYEKLDEAVVEQIKLTYPYGFEGNLVKFTNAKGDRVSALPFETDDRYYLVRMTVAEAQQIILDDEDYDEDGNLKTGARKAYTARHEDDDEDDDVDPLDAELDEMGFGDDDDDDGDEVDGPKGDGTVSLDGVDVVDPSST